MPFFRPIVASILIGLLLPGCMVGPNFTRPEARIQGKWKQFDGSTDRQPTGSEVYWWRQLRDPKLNQLVEIAYRNNPDLQAAAVRILAARAELNSTVGRLFPQRQEIGLSAGRFSPTDSAGSSGFLGGAQSIVASQAVFSATWEIDFWGKYRRQIQADRARYLSSIAAYDSALVSLIADVANTYVNIRTSQARLAVARENIRLQERTLQIAEARLEAGQTHQLDVAMAQTQLAATEALVPTLQDGLDRSINGLATLLGEPPAETRRRLGSGGSLPQPPARIAVGVPHDLLRRRPDVRQAGLVAASQSARIGVEFANLLPSFSLNGSFGYGTGGNYTSLSNIFNWQQSVADSAGSLVVPILNYGRIVNQVRVQDAVFQQAVLEYQKTVLQAQREVEDAISSYTQSRQKVSRLQSAVDAARRSVDISRAQYEAGTVTFTTVVTNEQAMLVNQEALALARGDVMLSLVGIYRSLGGGWEIREGGDVLSPQVKEQMASRTNWGRLLEKSQFMPAQTVAPLEEEQRTTDGHR